MQDLTPFTPDPRPHGHLALRGVEVPSQLHFNTPPGLHSGLASRAVVPLVYCRIRTILHIYPSTICSQDRLSTKAEVYFYSKTEIIS